MAKPRNLKEIALAGSGVAGLAGCDELVSEVRVERHGTEEFKEGLYDTALYSGLTLCGMYLLYKWIKKDL